MKTRIIGFSILLAIGLAIVFLVKSPLAPLKELVPYTGPGPTQPLGHGGILAAEHMRLQMSKHHEDGALTVPGNGKVSVKFKVGFQFEPSCTVSGATLPGETIYQNGKGFHMKAKPNGQIKWICYGIPVGETDTDTM